MSDRTRSSTKGASRSSKTSGLASSSSSSRPTLYRSQLMRRATASSTTSAETLRPDPDGYSDTSEIVIRDQQGKIDIENPPTPVVDDEDELAAIEDKQEMEKEKQRLSEAVKRYQVGHNSVSHQSEELLEAVRTSLRAKVSSLADDNWMYEPEEQSRG